LILIDFQYKTAYTKSIIKIIKHKMKFYNKNEPYKKNE